MAIMSNGAGCLADVSYSVPDDACRVFCTHFEIFGTLGAVRFSWQDAPAMVYYKDKEEAISLEAVDIGRRSYWTDFLDEIKGKKNLILTTEDVIRSTESALMVQHRSYKEEEKCLLKY